MMTASKAMEILRVQTLSQENLDKAYEKMIHRYPAGLFPEKFRLVRKAYDFLTNSDDYWREVIEEDHFEVFPVLGNLSKEKVGVKEAPQLESDSELLSRVLAPFLRKTIYLPMEDGTFFN